MGKVELEMRLEELADELEAVLWIGDCKMGREELIDEIDYMMAELAEINEARDLAQVERN